MEIFKINDSGNHIIRQRLCQALVQGAIRKVEELGRRILKAIKSN